MKRESVFDPDADNDLANAIGFGVGLVGVLALVLTVLAVAVPNVAGVLGVIAFWGLKFVAPVVLAVCFLAWLMRRSGVDQ